jgi:diguanylate cyclase (GGDEF)-like protein/PAS domain S-box-containing protein
VGTKLANFHDVSSLDARTAEQADYIRGKQLQALRSLAPVGLLASSLNAAILIIYFAVRSPSDALWAWTAIMVLMAMLGARASLHALKTSATFKPRPVAALRRPIMESAMLGAAWGLSPIIFIPSSQGFDLAIVLWVGTGMMAGGAYMLSTLPAAAVPYVTALAFGTAVGMLRTGIGGAQLALLALLASYTFMMIRSVFWNHRNYVRTWMQQAKLIEQAGQLEKKSDVISLLLNEFEQAASDTLWETDANHCLVRPSDVLVERTGFSFEDLDGTPMILFFDATNLEAYDELERLKAILAVNGEVNNFRLPLRRMDRTEWWRISAKPVFDDAGVFEGYRGVASDVTEKYEAEKQIYRLAHFDKLTGVPKRHVMLEALDEAAADAKDATSMFAVHVLDLDRFKTINDVFGHTVGDSYLKATAERIQELLGPDDKMARFGGDEFVILQQGISGRGEAMALASTIQLELARPINVDGSYAQSSVSVGISLYPEHSTCPTELLKFSDLALLSAKGAGRDTACFFDTEMNEDVSERIAIEADLRQALERNEFSLHFQPIVNAETGRFGAFETLLRWTHPVRGSVGPDLFVPILEQSGLITNVGDWVIRTAFREAASWDESVRISINLSPLQVRNRSLVTTVTHALAQTNLDPRRVDFEITETALFDDTEESLTTLRALRNLGVTISLDDFGTGFSSLSLLRTFPYDKIKIDKSFVLKMEESDECMAIVRSIIGLAGSLGMRCTAEGVESKEVADLLIAEGCVELQGYHFGRPQLPDDLVKAEMLSWKRFEDSVLEDFEEDTTATEPFLRHVV